MKSAHYILLMSVALLAYLGFCGAARACTVELCINAVPDHQEEDPGGYVALNDDDDNDNGTPDKDENPIIGDDDLVELWLWKDGPDDGTVTLSATAGGSRIKVWTEVTKETEVSLPHSWDLTIEVVPNELYVEGIAASGSARDIGLKLEWVGSGAPANPQDKVRITVVALNTLTWETYGSNTPLDTKNGGKRIYPGKKTYDDGSAADRKKVTIKATITPAKADVPVYFSWWDVDDPSSSTSPIDTNDTAGQPHGDDNRGSGESLSATSANTDASGHATVTFTVSMQPGDNFKICASLHQNALNKVTQAKADGRESLPLGVTRSEMLTTWRKLHVEVDSMGKEYETGTSTGLTNTTLTDTTKSWTADQFNNYNEDWDLCPDTSDSPPHEFTIADTTETVITVAGGSQMTQVAQAGDAYKVEFKGFPADDTLRGDIPNPDIAAFSDAFDDAYITPVADTGNNNSATPWHWNFNGSGNDLKDYAASHAGTTGAADFWVAYIIGIYERESTKDNDPDNELCETGTNYAPEPEYAFVLNENHRDCASQHSWTGPQITHSLKRVALHEIGHHFELPDESGADKNTHVMWGPLTDAEEDKRKNLPLVFKDADLDKIRDCTNP